MLFIIKSGQLWGIPKGTELLTETESWAMDDVAATLPTDEPCTEGFFGCGNTQLATKSS